jgi:hypothetical protein
VKHLSLLFLSNTKIVWQKQTCKMDKKRVCEWIWHLKKFNSKHNLAHYTQSQENGRKRKIELLKT